MGRTELRSTLVDADSDIAAADGQNFDVEQSAEIDLVLSEFNGGFDLLFHDVILA